MKYVLPWFLVAKCCFVAVYVKFNSFCNCFLDNDNLKIYTFMCMSKGQIIDVWLICRATHVYDVCRIVKVAYQRDNSWH